MEPVFLIFFMTSLFFGIGISEIKKDCKQKKSQITKEVKNGKQRH